MFLMGKNVRLRTLLWRADRGPLTAVLTAPVSPSVPGPTSRERMESWTFWVYMDYGDSLKWHLVRGESKEVSKENPGGGWTEGLHLPVLVSKRAPSPLCSVSGKNALLAIHFVKNSLYSPEAWAKHEAFGRPHEILYLTLPDPGSSCWQLSQLWQSYDGKRGPPCLLSPALYDLH